MLVPLVVVELEEYHQPFGFLKVTLVKEVQDANAYLSMLVTLLPITTLVKDLQPSNAP